MNKSKDANADIHIDGQFKIKRKAFFDEKPALLQEMRKNFQIERNL